jgi:hypothetical protein
LYGNGNQVELTAAPKKLSETSVPDSVIEDLRLGSSIAVIDNRSVAQLLDCE